MLCQTFLSPQVKPCAIITYKHGVYELPHALPNGLGLRKLKNIRKVSKPQLNPSPGAHHPTQKPEPVPNIPRLSAATHPAKFLILARPFCFPKLRFCNCRTLDNHPVVTA